jgi:predicted heme/steroid binding protein/uncharacterized membrane protein
METAMREIEHKELEQFDGREGNPAYIVHQNRVFDVTGSKLWRNGLHMRRHKAGTDLTQDIGAAPHGPEVLERYPQVAVLKQTGAEETRVPGFLAGLLKRFPMLRRHPHPMTIHFPIVFMFSVTIFNLLYLLTGIRSFESTALHCLGAGLLFTPLAMGTGYYTWWLNYQARSFRPVTIKKRLAPVLFCTALTAFIIRLALPDILTSFRGLSFLYLLLVVSLLPLVTVIGWFGAMMTFPLEGD